MRHLIIVKEQSIPHFPFPREPQIIIRKYMGNPLAAFLIHFGGHPLGNDDRLGLGQSFLLPLGERSAGAKDINIFGNAGMKRCDHNNTINQDSRGLGGKDSSERHGSKTT
jgi:hypothetical protein